MTTALTDSGRQRWYYPDTPGHPSEPYFLWLCDRCKEEIDNEDPTWSSVGTRRDEGEEEPFHERCHEAVLQSMGVSKRTVRITLDITPNEDDGHPTLWLWHKLLNLPDGNVTIHDFVDLDSK